MKIDLIVGVFVGNIIFHLSTGSSWTKAIAIATIAAFLLTAFFLIISIIQYVCKQKH